MQQTIDFEAFRANLGGDVAMEAVLLRLFVECGDGALAQLSHNPDDWTQQMHLLKGAALNVCAPMLAAVAEEAESIPATDGVARERLLEQLQVQYADVRERIQTRLAEI